MDTAASRTRAASIRLARRRRVERLASEQAGVIGRPEVYAASVTRAEVRANLAAGRWQRVGRQALVTHNGPVTEDALRWVAVIEAGPRAILDGVSSLQAAGLRNFDQDVIRVSVPRGARVRRVPGVDIRQTRRWAPDDVVAAPGVPRSRNEVAGGRGALWARSDRQAALVLTMAVQQGLTTADGLAREMLQVRRDRRRSFIHAVLLDLLDGVRSLGELDFARLCRERGLPEPSRQVVRRGRKGKYYLDVFWDDWSVVVEVDGIHHSWAQNVVDDALRHNDVALGAHTVLRLPLLGLRVAPDDFFTQIERALAAAGWADFSAGRHAQRSV